MYSEFNFAKRLSELRAQKGVSARDMSLSLGQNASYVNKLENGKAMPSMEVFFYICDYLEVTPSDFFDDGKRCPQKISQVAEECAGLTGETLNHLLALLKILAGHSK